MCMRAEDRGDASGQVPAHGHLLAGRLGMHIDDHDRRLAVRSVDQLVHDREH